MLRELKEAFHRFRKEGVLLPPAYKEKHVSWFVHLGEGKASLEGPYGKREGVAPIPAPDRQRSGKPSEGNLKPYLLVDDARYVLGLPEEGREKEAALLHKGFKKLTKKVWQDAKDPDVKVVLKAVLDFLTSPELEDLREEFRRRGGKPKELLAFKVHGVLPTELEEVQAFWARHLAEEIQGDEGFCALCGNLGPVLRIFPREVVVLGQKCQLTSFNQRAFESFGKKQTENAPLCFTCASEVVDVLDHLIRSERHRRVLHQEAEGGLKNQLAVFWLDQKVELLLDQSTDPIDLEALLASVVDQEDISSAPLPELSQLRELLALPWTGREWALNLDETAFHLAVLSANKGRLVVREWFSVSLARLRQALSRFLEGTRLVRPWGEAPHPLPVGALAQALGDGNPGLIWGLLRTAYLGTPPPHALSMATHLLRNPKVLTPEDREGWRRLHALVAALKLWLFYGEKEAKRMAELDRERKDPAYLSGRLLAVLEEAQKRASGYTLKRTLVDRFYGAASTTPAATFGALLRLSTAAHLPKAGKELNQAVEEILSQLDEAGGFPRTLNLIGQAEFALGFYHQRAYFRANRSKKAEKEEATKAETEAVAEG